MPLQLSAHSILKRASNHSMGSDDFRIQSDRLRAVHPPLSPSSSLTDPAQQLPCHLHTHLDSHSLSPDTWHDSGLLSPNIWLDTIKPPKYAPIPTTEGPPIPAVGTKTKGCNKGDPFAYFTSKCATSLQKSQDAALKFSHTSPWGRKSGPHGTCLERESDFSLLAPTIHHDTQLLSCALNIASLLPASLARNARTEMRFEVLYSIVNVSAMVWMILLMLWRPALLSSAFWASFAVYPASMLFLTLFRAGALPLMGVTSLAVAVWGAYIGVVAYPTFAYLMLWVALFSIAWGVLIMCLRLSDVTLSFGHEPLLGQDGTSPSS